ncbi:MAG: carbamate kinase [Micromonosporaceae bacterium]|jgi:carbamate kinase|nr:carbamate kinase [Micromonosporaceae bacterium]
MSGRVLIALGGNAMTSADGSTRPDDQIAAVTRAAEPIADVVAGGTEVVLTHGNGPQVGNLLVKNEMAASVVPPVPLDWCGAQTQGTIGVILLNALERALVARGVPKSVAAIVTRSRVDPADAHFREPSKPIGRYLPAAQARAMMDHGQVWQDRGDKGWRRVVASPQPLEVLDATAVSALLAAGFVVIAAGGGGIPTVRDADGTLRGVEAVIDKDLTAALLGQAIGADILVIATDVPGASLHFGTSRERPLGLVSVEEMRAYQAEGHFAGGSMGPKVDAACRFVSAGGARAVITSLERIADAIHDSSGASGTTVTLGRQPLDGYRKR